MQLGLGSLGLAPDAFWQMTLPELQAALPAAGAAVLSRDDLNELMRYFPD
jgi:uncharacterized phage protein (TIGR02216 family)